MKKLYTLLATFILSVFVLTACGANNTAEVDENGNTAIDELVVSFVPSRDPDDIVTATKPLENLLKEELLNHGFAVQNVSISVGTSFDAVGQGLSAGTIDVGFIPSGTYVLFEDGVEVILTATRQGLNKDYDEASAWNNGLPTENIEEQVTHYRSIILAGPSEKGRELAEIVNSGGELTWEDLNSATWSVMSSTSPAGYIYPTLWLKENFNGRGITDLNSAAQADSYGSSIARLAAEQIDIMPIFGDGRMDFTDAWIEEFGQELIWEDIQVIGVTMPIFNDTISVSRHSNTVTPELRDALQQAFINIGQTEEGLEVIAIYNHMGYLPATSSDFDDERAAQELIRDLAE